MPKPPIFTVITVAAFIYKHQDKGKHLSKAFNLAKGNLGTSPRNPHATDPLVLNVHGKDVSLTLSHNRLGLTAVHLNVLSKPYKTYRGVSVPRMLSGAVSEIRRVSHELSLADTTDPQMYWCPTVGEVEHETLSGFDVCCAKPHLHVYFVTRPTATPPPVTVQTVLKDTYNGLLQSALDAAPPQTADTIDKAVENAKESATKAFKTASPYLAQLKKKLK